MAVAPAEQVPPRRQVRALFARLLRIGLRLVLVAIGCLELFAWLLPQDFSDGSMPYLRFAAIAFFTRVFQLHIGIVVAGLSLVAWLARAPRTAAATVMLACALLLPFAREYAPKHPPTPATPTLRLMAINLYYANRDADAIVAAIRAANPDVIVMAEMTEWSRREVLRTRLRGAYPYWVQPRYDGAADVVSRVPIRSGGAVPAGAGGDGRQPVVLDVGGREVALYPVHLVSPGEPWLVGHNREQVETFARIAAGETRPMLIAGDFNFTPLTPNFARLRAAGLRTTHELCGWGVGHTWGPMWWPRLNRLPGVRIDHIFMSTALTATRHEVGPYTGSDHRPVFADIAIARP